jgi:hypothetical protein
LPHLHARGQRRGNVQAIADVEPRREHGETGNRHRKAPPGHRVQEQEDARKKQRRAKIFLQEEERERGANSQDDGHNIVGSGNVEPCRQAASPKDAAFNLPEQLPAASEITCEKQRQEQPDRFHRLHRTKIHLCAARSGALAKQDQQHRQKQRAQQRNVAEPEKRGLVEIDERDRAHRAQPDEHTNGVPTEEQRVPQRISAGQQRRKTKRRQEVCR